MVACDGRCISNVGEDRGCDEDIDLEVQQVKVAAVVGGCLSRALILTALRSEGALRNANM
jgi:hypothetical protein